MDNVKILLVEDNPGDIRLTQEALKDTRLNISLSVVTDGVQAIKYLKKEEGYENSELPDIILLDLNLPKKDGREVLAEIKTQDELKRIPVVVLTTSNAEKDINKSYELHANSYINKPVDLEHFFEVVRTIENFWFNTVKLPTYRLD